MDMIAIDAALRRAWSRSPVVLYEVPVDQIDEVEFSCHELRTLEELKALVSSEPDVVARFFDALEKKASADAPRLFD